MTKEDILGFLTAHKQELQSKYNVEQIGLFGICKSNVSDLLDVSKQIKSDLS